MKERLGEKFEVAERERGNRLKIERPHDEAKVMVLWLFSIGQNFFFVFPFIQKPWVGWARLRYYLPALTLIPFLAAAFPVTLIYSFANTNDVSWGNRPKIEGDTSVKAQEEAKKEGQIKSEYSWYRYKILAFWMICTIAHISMFITHLDPVDPILGGNNIWTIYVLLAHLLLAMIPCMLDIAWYYTVEYCVWMK